LVQRLYGRLASPDSLFPDPFSPQSLNRYGYVMNNPLRYTDPTGPRACDDFDAGGRCVTAPPAHVGITRYTTSTIGKQMSVAKAAVGTVASSDGQSTGQGGQGGSPLGRESGAGGVTSQASPPAHPDPSLVAPEALSLCPASFTYVQCFYSGGLLALGPQEQVIHDQFRELAIAILFDLENRAPVAGLDPYREVYDTPFWDAGTLGGNLCFGDTCYARHEVNYIAQGMWSAASDQTLAQGHGVVWAWKLSGLVLASDRSAYLPLGPSEGTIYWFDVGYQMYQPLEPDYMELAEQYAQP
jgi:hypothetical protein